MSAAPLPSRERRGGRRALRRPRTACHLPRFMYDSTRFDAARVRLHTLVRCMPIALATLLALALSCAPRKVEEIVFWQFWPGDVITPLLQKFERENPAVHVRVQTLSWSNGLDSITAAVAGGVPPDLCELGSTWVPRLMSAGALADW